jgi:hypothetical protein
MWKLKRDKLRKSERNLAKAAFDLVKLYNLLFGVEHFFHIM